MGHLSKEEKLKAINLCKKKTIKEVAEQFNVNTSTIREWKKKDLVSELKKEKEEINQIISLYEKYGLGGAKKVADKLNLSYEKVRKILRNENYDLGNHCYNQKTKNKARQLYKKLNSSYKVSEKLNIDPTVIHSWIKDLVPPNRKKRNFSSKEKIKAISLRKEGHTLSEIAKKIGCYSPSVVYWFNNQDKILGSHSN